MLFPMSGWYFGHN